MSLECLAEVHDTCQDIVCSCRCHGPGKLILCSGPQKIEGFVHLDCESRFEPEICATIPPLPSQVTSKQWKEIYLIHGIEHFTQADGVALLGEIYRVLEPGGLLVMEQPNIGACAEHFDGEHHIEAMAGIFGSDGLGPGMIHRWGYTPYALSKLCQTIGFRDVKAGPARTHKEWRDFRVECVK